MVDSFKCLRNLAVLTHMFIMKSQKVHHNKEMKAVFHKHMFVLQKNSKISCDKKIDIVKIIMDVSKLLHEI